ncbi:MAG TPA: DMT family transporter [Micromonosporaceae bacterium]|jgi:drug/metabolite transporter (DMT)-like permease
MSRRAWLIFAAVSVLWGIPYLFIKIAIGELAPPVVVVGRTAIAAVVLLPMAMATGALRPLRDRLGLVVVLAMVHITGPFLLITYGEVHITSSLTALLLASQPMMIAALAPRFAADERVSRRGLAGLAVGLAGVAAVVGFDVSGDRLGLLGAGMVLLATLGYASASLLVRRKLADAPPLGLVAGTMTVTTVVLAPWALAAAPHTMPSARATWSVVVLGLLCTAVALLLFYRLITLVGAGRAAVVSYLNPAVAVALGVIVLGEPLTATALLGAALILAGSWLSTRRPTAPVREPEPVHELEPALQVLGSPKNG